MLVTRAGLSPVMVGRDPELAQLRRLAAEAKGPTIALIGGEPGIGKTRLASELIGEVASGTTVLLCQGDPGGMGQPYQLLLDLAGESSGKLAEELRTGDPMARSRAAVDLLRELVAGGPAVLVVDDLHWADPDSLAVFEQLDEVTADPLLLVGTYRPDELSRRHPLASALERLDRRRGVTHLRLQRLAAADTAQFLSAVGGRTPSRRTVTALHNRTGGNPFFLEELLKAAGEADLDEIHTMPLPWNLAEALRSRLDGLDDDRREVVEAAAVLAGRASFDLLAAVTGRDEGELIAALRELVDRGLLVEAEDDHFTFRHALTREAVAGELLARQRRRLHEVALEALLTAPTPDHAAIAAHARGAGRYGEMVAAARKGATDLLASGAAYAALTLAELALAEVPDDFPLLLLAGGAAWRAGLPGDARQHATGALQAAADDAQQVESLTQLIRICWEQGETSDMDRYAEQVRAMTEVLPDGEVRVRATAAVAQAYMLRDGPGDPVEWAERACRAADEHGLKDVRLAALVEKGTAQLRRPGASIEGCQLLTEVATEAEHAGAHLQATRAWHNLFWFLHPGDPAAPEVLERAREDGERAGMTVPALSNYHAGKAWLAVVDGDLDGAIGVLEQVRRLDRSITAVDPASGAPVALHQALSGGKNVRGRLVELYLERGDLDPAEAVLSEAPPSRRWRELAYGFKFQLACRRGDPTTARHLLGKLVGAGEQLPGSALHCQVAAGLAGGLEVAELASLVEWDTGHEGPDHPLRAMVLAQLAEAREQYAEALAGYEEALAAAGGSPPRCCDAVLVAAYQGSAAAGAARCLAQLGGVDDARARLAVARSRLGRWSGWRVAELAVVARRLGETPGPAGNGVLTAREREVAALLADGLTNSEIAHRLVISRKTVAVHVSHILAKLEMSSRTQVAAWVTRQGLG